MRFRNTHPTGALSFEIGGQRYAVGVGGTCEIPDRFAYAVKPMGLFLEPAEDEAKPEVRPQPEPDKRRK